MSLSSYTDKITSINIIFIKYIIFYIKHNIITMLYSCYIIYINYKTIQNINFYIIIIINNIIIYITMYQIDIIDINIYIYINIRIGNSLSNSLTGLARSKKSILTIHRKDPICIDGPGTEFNKSDILFLQILI